MYKPIIKFVLCTTDQSCIIIGVQFFIRRSLRLPFTWYMILPTFSFPFPPSFSLFPFSLFTIKWPARWKDYGILILKVLIKSICTKPEIVQQIVFQHYLIIAVVCLFLLPLHLVPQQSLGHHWWPAGAPNLQQVLIDALVALDALLHGVSHQLSLYQWTTTALARQDPQAWTQQRETSWLNSSHPVSKHPPRSGEELRSQFVTQEIKMLSPKRGQSQGYCWSLGHISQHHRWSSAGPMCKHYQPKSKESVVNLWQLPKIQTHQPHWWNVKNKSLNLTSKCPAYSSLGQSAQSTCPP